MPHFEALQKDLNTDVLIIGGGLAGVLCAYRLQQAGIDYTLVEQNRICSGVTANTTAKITSQHGLIYDKLIRRFGLEKASMYLRANEKALAEYRRLCENADCDFQTQDSFVYCLDDASCIQKEVSALKKLAFPAEEMKRLPLPFSVAGAVKFPRQAQFNLLKFVCEICKDLRIFERTKVRELVGMTAITKNGKIHAKKIIVATHFPFLNKHGSYFLKLYQHRSYVLALSGAEAPQGMYVDAAKSGLSFRLYGDLLLLGGGSHRTGKHGGNWLELEEFAKRYYPSAQIRYKWATQDCMSLDDVPYIGHYSARTPDLYVATGFNKWGITSSMTAAMLLSDLVQGKENPYASVFSPSRSILRPQLAINGVESTVNLLTPTTKRCPHLGCALKWNEAEQSWDCPCHGSRFSADGTLLNNPATAGLQIKQK